jgi:DNA-binding response OmpR family regulator
MLDDVEMNAAAHGQEVGMYKRAECSRILVVDDNLDTANGIAELLARPDYQVEVAYDGREAIEKESRFRPHLVILDIAMPIMNGNDAARGMRYQTTDRGRVVLIALTGRSTSRERNEAHAAGFDLFIPKPIDAQHLCELVEGALSTMTADAVEGDALDDALVGRHPRWAH